jgi:hypothetical protein
MLLRCPHHAETRRPMRLHGYTAAKKFSCTNCVTPSTVRANKQASRRNVCVDQGLGESATATRSGLTCSLTSSEQIMHKSLFAASAVTLGLMSAALSLPARADGGDITFNAIFAMADKNKDTMVTKQEFLDAMSKAYDMKMAKMKSSKDSMMMKGDAMTKDGFKSLINDLHSGA